MTHRLESGLATRVRPLRDRDHERVLHEALAVRRAGAIPLIGDERWGQDQWRGVVEHATGAIIPDEAEWAALTSGSTGCPRTILRIQQSWDISYPFLDEWGELTPADTMLIAAHPVSSMASYAASHAAHTGFRFNTPVKYRMGPGDIGNVSILHGTPWHLRDLVDLLDAGHPTRIRAAFVGGDRLPQQLRHRAEHHGIRVLGYFGAAELSMVAIDDGDGLRAFPGVDLRIRDGVLWARTDQRALAVLGTGGTYRIRGAWATVGDRAVIRNGRLSLRGRSDDAIQTAGATVRPNDVEEVLASVHGVEAATVIGVPDERAGQLVVAALETDRRDTADLLERVKKNARAQLTPAHIPRRWKTTTRLPRTGSGKIRRPTPEEFEELR